ncbi:bile acid-CoA:amino acid N-acyltransferase-like [Diadema setosum]|uniref:bile acid-CoA:amino acid N-acyltransferase-like n=1 Tax=Diadema setosum TaxID=31175 RepID=UPI003B3B30F1
MGLLWSVVPDNASAKKLAILSKLDSTIHHWNYKFDICDGEKRGTTSKTDYALDSRVVKRLFLAPNVEISSIKCGSAEGTLYLPRQEVVSGPLPFIIDMPGMAPRNVKDRPVLLSSHGFAVFDFHYFNSVKEDIERDHTTACFNMGLFYDIIEFVKSHPRLDEARIGINGACFGGTLALHTLSRLSDLPIRCMVLQRCVDTLVGLGLQNPDGSVAVKTEVVSDYSTAREGEDGRKWSNFEFDHPIFDEDACDKIIPQAENISCPLLLIVCGDDQQCPSEKCLTRVANRLRKAGKGHLLSITHLPGAGHLLLSPFLPLCTQSRLYMPDFTEVTYVNWGGERTVHCKAQETAWRKSINFFRHHLGPMKMLRHDWIDGDQM